MLIHSGLSDAVDAFAEATGCPLAVEDGEFRVLAYSAVPGHVEDPVRSEAILHRRTPERWLTWIDKVPGRRERLESGQPLVVDDAFPGLRRRTIKALRADSVVVAYLWILEGAAGYPSTLERDLEDFERRVAAEISRSTTRSGWSAESRLVRLLVSGDLTHESLAGSGVRADWVVTASVIRGAPDGYLYHEDLQEMSDAVRDTVRGIQGHVSMTGIVTRRVCRLDFFANRPGRHDLRSLEACVVAARARLGRPVVMGIGNPVHIAKVNQSWLQAQEVGQLLLAGGPGEEPAAVFADVQAQCVTGAAATYLASRPELIGDLVLALEGNGEGAVAEHKKTIDAYLEHNFSIPRTAAALNLHPNSLRYRLGRIQRDLPVDLNDATGRLALHLTSRAAGKPAAPQRQIDFE